MCQRRHARTTAALPSLLHACPRAGCCALSSFLRALFPSSSVNRNPRETQGNLGLLTLRTLRFDANRRKDFSASLPAATILKMIEVLSSESNRTFLHTGPVTDLLNATGFRTRVWSLSRHHSPDRSPFSSIVWFPSLVILILFLLLPRFLSFFFIHDPRGLLVSRFLAVACRRERDEK